jgi:hypothetical protein
MNSAWQIVTNLCENSGIFASQSAQDASFVSVSDQRRHTTIKRHNRRFVHDLWWGLLCALLSCPAPQLQCCDSAWDADTYVTLRLSPMLAALEGCLRVRALLRYATVTLLTTFAPLLLASPAAIDSAHLWLTLPVTVLLSAAAWYVSSWSKLEGPTRVTVRVLHRHINWWCGLRAKEKLRVTAVDELVRIGEDIVLKGGCGSTEAQHLRALVMSEDEEVMWLEYLWCMHRTD